MTTKAELVFMQFHFDDRSVVNIDADQIKLLSYSYRSLGVPVPEIVSDLDIAFRLTEQDTEWLGVRRGKLVRQ